MGIPVKPTGMTVVAGINSESLACLLLEIAEFHKKSSTPGIDRKSTNNRNITSVQTMTILSQNGYGNRIFFGVNYIVSISCFECKKNQPYFK